MLTSLKSAFNLRKTAPTGTSLSPLGLVKKFTPVSFYLWSEFSIHRICSYNFWHLLGNFDLKRNFDIVQGIYHCARSIIHCIWVINCKLFGNSKVRKKSFPEHIHYSVFFSRIILFNRIVNSVIFLFGHKDFRFQNLTSDSCNNSIQMLKIKPCIYRRFPNLEPR